MASTIQSTGIGSGLDIGSIVTQLTTAQGDAQTKQLTARKTDLDAQVSAYGTFRAALEALQATLPALKDANKFQGRSAAVGDIAIATATADSTATPAQYTLGVQSLATAASLVSAPIVNGTVGTGTLNITVGGVTAQVTIDSTNNSLAGIAAAINSAVGNPGVNASVINTAGGARLVLNGTKTGAINGITVTQSGGDGGLAQLVYDPLNSNTQLTQSQAPQDAQFTINGFAATSSSNAVSGVITGVTFNLLKATAVNTPTTVTVGYDQEGATSAITNFVTAYNALITSVKALTSYDVSTKTAGTLLGNTTVTSLVSKLRQLLSTRITSSTGGVQSLTDLGVTSNLQGTLDQRDSKIGAALTTDLTSVTNLLGGKNGLAAQLDTALTQYTQPSGLLDTISKGLNSGLADVSSKQRALQLRLATYSATLTKQFNAMDAAVASLKQTQNFLTQAFNSINGTKSSSTSG